MKKFLLTSATILPLFCSAPAFAKTQGSSIGLDFISTTTAFYGRVYYKDFHPSADTDLKPTRRETFGGMGLNYKYAVNFDGLFVAPEIFVEQNSFGNKGSQNPETDALQIRNRYGFKTNIGYDINDYVAPFINVGYAATQYNSTSAAYDNSNTQILNASHRGTASSVTLGGGIKFSLSKNVALNCEYNYQKFHTKSQVNNTINYIQKYKQIARSDIVKIGLSYQF